MRTDAYARTDLELVRFVPEIIKVDFTAASVASATVNELVIQPGTFVVGIAVCVKTAFSGGTPSLTVGDGDAADAYFAAADLTGVTGAMYKWSSNSAQAASDGKYYPTGGVITATGAAGMTAGAAELHVLCYKTDLNWRDEHKAAL